jgi:hypothetical protein
MQTNGRINWAFCRYRVCLLPGRSREGDESTCPYRLCRDWPTGLEPEADLWVGTFHFSDPRVVRPGASTFTYSLDQSTHVIS